MSVPDHPAAAHESFDRWAERVVNELVPMIDGSAATIGLVPRGPSDVKFALELGLSIMLDKPIIAVVTPGVKVPERLVRVADRIVETAGSPADTSARIAAALNEIQAAL